MTLTVLSVAYTRAAVGPDSAGGAEQVLAAIDRALVAAGHRSIVVALAGSGVAGTLVPVPPPGTALDDAAAELQARFSAAVAATLARFGADIVHLHGLDFAACLPPPGPPALVTLHLPPVWYDPASLCPARQRTWFNCVSATQHRAVPPGVPLVAPIANGVPIGALGAARHAKRRFVLGLGRICPEKGFELALEAARRAGVPMLLAGAVFGYPAHERHFRDAIVPRLDRTRRFLGPVGFARKRRLLAAARALLVPSRAAETSSLVAMEALACGTPVIAFPAGALAEIVEHGRTGFLVEDAAAMADAIGRAHEIDPALCRAAAQRRFSSERMTGEYIARYRALARADAYG